MSKELTNYLSAKDIKQQVHLIQEVMKAVMVEGEHYGVIPGTQKHTLFQTGAQKLLSTFRLGSEPEVLNVDETYNSVSYRVKVRLFNIADGNTVGYGLGECSTLEDKYCWKKAINDTEFARAAENEKRIKINKDYEVKQVMTNYKDVSNTVLKMATKRALIAAVLTATAAGDIFTQDLEDMEEQTRESIIEAEIENTVAKNRKSSPAPIGSVQDIRDGVTLLGFKTIIKEEAGKQLLFVAGNTFSKKDALAKMGFKVRKPDGSQFWETFMDVTELMNAGQNTKPSHQNTPLSQNKDISKCIEYKNYAEFVSCLEKNGIEVMAKQNDKGKTFVKITKMPDNINAEIFVKFGFSQKDGMYIKDVSSLMTAQKGKQTTMDVSAA